MKREIKETKKSLDSRRKPKVSQTEPLPKKAKIAKDTSDAALKTKVRAKKPEAKNLISKSAAEKAVEASAKTVKQTAKKTTAKDNSKIKKLASPVINRKNNAKAQKSSLIPVSKSVEKKKLIVVKGKNDKPKALKKSVAEAENKKSESIKKASIVKKIVKSKTQPKAVKIENPKTKKSLPVVSTAGKKKNLSGVAKNAKTPALNKSTVAVQSEKPKTQKRKPLISVKNSKPVAPKAQKKIVVNPKAEKTGNKKIKATAPVQKVKSQTVKPVPSVKKVQVIERKIVVEKVSLPKKPVNKKAKPISSAVLRGKKGRYDFEVFPLDANFEAVSAIYVITKRITDKRKRGHHKLVCIGQTESIVDGIKMHKKDKCIKQNEANVICLLKEESEKNRLKIADDLREAHAISCNRQ